MTSTYFYSFHLSLSSLPYRHPFCTRRHPFSLSKESRHPCTALCSTHSTSHLLPSHTPRSRSVLVPVTLLSYLFSWLYFWSNFFLPVRIKSYLPSFSLTTDIYLKVWKKKHDPIDDSSLLLDQVNRSRVQWGNDHKSPFSVSFIKFAFF